MASRAVDTFATVNELIFRTVERWQPCRPHVLVCLKKRPKRGLVSPSLQGWFTLSHSQAGAAVSPSSYRHQQFISTPYSIRPSALKRAKRENQIISMRIDLEVLSSFDFIITTSTSERGREIETSARETVPRSFLASHQFGRGRVKSPE